jgi:phage regulator Rha-like protein
MGDHLIPTGGTLTMSSREIAALLEVRHDSVKRAIERLCEKGVIVQPPAVDEPGSDAMGRPRVTQVYQLCKRDSYVVVAQLSPEFTARLVDRWQELEGELAARRMPIAFDPSDPDQLIPLLSAYATRTKEAEAQIAEYRPKVDAYDRIEGAEGSMTVRPASKVLGVQEKKLIRWLELNRWAFRQSGKGPLQAYREKIAAGYLDHRLSPYTDPGTGETKTSITLLITPKGIARLAQLLPKDLH